MKKFFIEALGQAFIVEAESKEAAKQKWAELVLKQPSILWTIRLADKADVEALS